MAVSSIKNQHFTLLYMI